MNEFTLIGGNNALWRCWFVVHYFLLKLYIIFTKIIRFDSNMIWIFDGLLLVSELQSRTQIECPVWQINRTRISYSNRGGWFAISCLWYFVCDISHISRNYEKILESWCGLSSLSNPWSYNGGRPISGWPADDTLMSLACDVRSLWHEGCHLWSRQNWISASWAGHVAFRSSVAAANWDCRLEQESTSRIY